MTKAFCPGESTFCAVCCVVRGNAVLRVGKAPSGWAAAL